MFNLTAPHIHLLINHLPVVGIMAAVLLLIWALLRNNAELKRTALLAFVLVGILAYFADATGDDAADVVRRIPGIDRHAVALHNDSADASTLTSEIAGAVALIGLILGWRKKVETATENSAGGYVRLHKVPPTSIVIVVLLVGSLDVYFMVKTANLGGAIRHPEIESTFKVPPAQPGQSDSE